MSKRKWAVGKFRAMLPITNRLRFGSGVLTQCGVKPLAHNALQAQFLNSAENDGRVDVGCPRLFLMLAERKTRSRRRKRSPRG